MTRPTWQDTGASEYALLGAYRRTLPEQAHLGVHRDPNENWNWVWKFWNPNGCCAYSPQGVSYVTPELAQEAADNWWVDYE